MMMMSSEGELDSQWELRMVGVEDMYIKWKRG
jgi:hypothetical protein